MKKHFYLSNFILLTLFLFAASPSFGSSGDFTITPSLHNFFGINVGSNSGSQLFTLYNNSDSAIDVDTVSLEGSNYGEFSISDDSLSGQNILPSSSASLEVTFSPTSEGCKHAYLKITVNGTESETVFVYLQGTGLKAGSIYLPTYDTPFNITYPGAETWYAVNLVKEESLSITLNSHLVTGYLDYGFYDAYGHELTGSNDYRIYNGEFGYANYSAKASGVYYIRVWGSGDAVGNYDLGVYNAWSNVGTIDSDRTFRSSFNTAHFIANTNFVLDAHPNEYFRFVANAGEEVVVSLTPHISVGNLDVNLLDLNGTVLKYSNDIGNGVNRTISRTVAVSGVYYVRIDRDSGAYGNYDLNISAGHEINADSDSDGLFDAAEYYHETALNSADTDGDGMSDPDELAMGRSPVHEYPLVNADLAMALGTAVDVPLFDSPFTVNLPTDSTATWYKMELIAGQGIAARLTPHIALGNLDINIHDCNGTLLASKNDIGNGRANGVDYTPKVGGTYYLKVDRDSGAYGSVDIAVYNAWSNAGVIDSNRGYSSSFKTAHYVANTDYLIDTDIYEYLRFVANAGDDVVISLTPHINVGNLDVHLQDRNGTTLRSYNEIGNGITRSITRTVAVDDVYYIRIDINGGAYGTYDLSISGGHEINTDSDSDGLFDAAEYYHGTALNSADTDGDGMSDPDELAMGRSPVHEYPLVNADLAMALGTAVDVPLFDSPFAVNLPTDSTATWYKFDLTVNQGISAQLTPQINLGNLDLNLHDCNGTLLVSKNDIGNGLTRGFDYTPKVSGTYYLKVDRDSGAYGGFDLAIYNAWSNVGVSDNDRDYFSTYKTSRQIDNDNFLLSDSDASYYFRMVANAGDDVVINLTPYIQIGNLDVNFFDRNGNRLKYSDDIGNGVTRTISRKVEASGVYYVRIDRDGGAYGSYGLSVSDGHEINVDSDGDGLYDVAEYFHGCDLNSVDTDSDGMSDPDEMAIGRDPVHEYPLVDADLATAIGTAVDVPQFDSPFKVDLPTDFNATYYRMVLAEGQGITALLSAQINLGNLDINLLSENGTRLKYADDIVNGATKSIGYTAPVAGVYYLRVDRDSGAYGSFDMSVYNAWFNPGNTDCVRDYYATLYTARYALSKNYILSSHANEYFRFLASAGDVVVINLTPHLNVGDLDLNLLDENGTRLTYVDNIGNGVTRTITRTLTLAGIYYIRIDRDGGSYGSFDLVVSGVEDSDHDGMLNEWEMHYFCTIDRDGSLDWDSDGLTDRQEHDLGTNPLKVDTEDDGMPDGWEVDNGLNPLVDDTTLDPDQDDLVNLDEYLNNTNPQDPDSEDDGMPDGWEVDNNLDPLLNDATGDPDLDDLNNLDEYTNQTDPQDADSEDDGMPDGWEVLNNLNPLTDDTTLDPDHDDLVNLDEYLNNTNPQDPDSEDDDMPDGWEVDNNLDPLLNDAAGDPDLDDLNNLDEYTNQTDPRDADSEDDGIPDGWEVLNNLNPLVDDTTLDPDHDDLVNLDEFSNNTNPQEADSEGDGMPDGWEVTYNLNPLVDDTGLDPDHDNVNNLEEYNRHTNPQKSDTEGDGMPDGWEIFYNLNPLINDAGSDPDYDNLINLHEYQQGTDPQDSDSENDGMPDGWEVTNGLNPLVNDIAGDPDHDDLSNLEEYANLTDPQDSDTEDDNMPDGWEVNNGLNPLLDDATLDPDQDDLVNLDEFTNSTNPQNPDSEDDGMPDGWEVANGLNPLVNDALADLDFDGLNNLAEFLAGTDPKDFDSDDDGVFDSLDLDPLNFWIGTMLGAESDLLSEYFVVKISHSDIGEETAMLNASFDGAAGFAVAGQRCNSLEGSGLSFEDDGVYALSEDGMGIMSTSTHESLDFTLNDGLDIFMSSDVKDSTLQEISIGVKAGSLSYENASLNGKYHFANLSQGSDWTACEIGSMDFNGAGTFNATMTWSKTGVGSDLPGMYSGIYLVNSDGTFALNKMGNIVNGGLIHDNRAFVAAAVSDVNQQSIWYGVKAGTLEYSDRSLVGTFSTTGYSVSSGGVFSSFSTITFDGYGSFKLKQTYNHFSGAIQEESGSGTYSVNEDGTFTLDYNGEITKGAISEDGLTLVVTGVSSIDFHSISFAVRPVDGDNDGVPCSEEMLAPNNGDGNDDHISDCQQNRVASLIGVNDDFCTIDISSSSNGSSLNKLSATTDEVFDEDSGYSYSCGMISFIVDNLNPGENQTVRIYFHGTSDLSGYIYRCFNPTTDIWSTLQGTVFGSRNIDGETVTYAEFTLEDGSMFDNDGTANGIITALGGPALPECDLVGDLDGDNDVDGIDCSLFIQSWGWAGTPGTNAADFDNNGVINNLDCEIFAQKWGGTCN